MEKARRTNLALIARFPGALQPGQDLTQTVDPSVFVVETARKFPRKRRRESGVTVVVFALFATTMVGLVGLAVDVANWMLMSSQTQNAADAAALAAATRSGQVAGVGGPNELALQVAERNGVPNDDKTDITVELISKTRPTDLSTVPRTGRPGFQSYSTGSAIAGWEIVSGSVYFVDTFWAPPAGSGGSIDLHAVTQGRISRTYDTVIGKRYKLSWKAAGNNVAPDTANVAYSVGATGSVFELKNAQVSANGGTLAWARDSYEFVATSTASVISFSSEVTVSSRNGAAITSIVFDELDEIRRTSASPQIKVTVVRKVPTYFASILGFEEFSVTKSARAEYRAGLPTGSVGNILGSDPERGIQQNFWLSAASPSVSKLDGQRYAAANCPPLDPLVATFSPYKCPKLALPGSNSEYHNEGQLFDINIDDGAASRGPLSVEIYDPAIAEETGDIGINPPTCSGVQVPQSDAMVVAANTNPGGTSWPSGIDMVKPVYPTQAQIAAYLSATGLPASAGARYLGGPVTESDGSVSQLSPWCTGERLAASTAEALAAMTLVCPEVTNPNFGLYPTEEATIESCQYPMDYASTFELYAKSDSDINPLSGGVLGTCTATFGGVRFAEERTGSVNTSKGGFGTKSIGGTFAAPTATQATVANLLTPGDGAFDEGDGLALATEFARTFHRWVPLCTFSGTDPDGDGVFRLEPGTYTLRARVSSAHAATNFFSLRATTGNSTNALANLAANPKASDGITISPRGHMAVYMFTPSVDGKQTTATFPFIRIPSNAKGATAKLELFDIGDVTALPDPTYKLNAAYVPTAKIEVLASNKSGGGSQNFSECSFTVESGPAGNPPERTVTPGCEFSGLTIATHDGRMMAVTAKIPDDYSCDDADFEECWLRVRVTYPPGTQPTDITSWEAVIDRPIVRLLPNSVS
jgi:Putative Flp pilus-assembly TadE/G-like/Protein of unknown function (DUF642)